MRSSIISYKEIDENTLRIDASYFLAIGRRIFGYSKSMTYKEAIEILKNYQCKSISEISIDLFYGTRFKRTYVEYEHGLPYLAGKTATQVFPTNQKFLSKEVHSNRIEKLTLKEGWIIVTCSGTIGIPMYVGREWEGYAVTHDLVRIIVDEKEILPGYLLAFLGSELWQAQIQRHVHGSVVDHITPDQVGSTLVPILDIEIMKEIHDKTMEAVEHLSKARELFSTNTSHLMSALIRNNKRELLSTNN